MKETSREVSGEQSLWTGYGRSQRQMWPWSPVLAEGEEEYDG